jgi:23S rRNA (cytosine1962-C5)-methyltransferase
LDIEFGDIKFFIKPSPFKHVGLFPEQSPNWDWTREVIKTAVTEGTKPSVLNLFGYTGGATLACAQAGASVTHVDASKAAITWAGENAEASGLKASAPIRWILEDALSFVKKEVKRGKKYDGIIMDPPAFGRGADGELWKIEDDFLALLDQTFKLLSNKPLFFLVNGYASGYSAVAYENNLKPLTERFGGTLESGELAIEEGNGPRLLPCGIFSRWSK